MLSSVTFRSLRTHQHPRSRFAWPTASSICETRDPCSTCRFCVRVLRAVKNRDARPASEQHRDSRLSGRGQIQGEGRGSSTSTRRHLIEATRYLFQIGESILQPVLERVLAAHSSRRTKCTLVSFTRQRSNILSCCRSISIVYETDALAILGNGGSRRRSLFQMVPPNGVRPAPVVRAAPSPDGFRRGECHSRRLAAPHHVRFDQLVNLSPHETARRAALLTRFSAILESHAGQVFPHWHRPYAIGLRVSSYPTRHGLALSSTSPPICGTNPFTFSSSLANTSIPLRPASRRADPVSRLAVGPGFPVARRFARRSRREKRRSTCWCA